MDANKLTRFAFEVDRQHRIIAQDKIVPDWTQLSKAQQARLMWAVRQYIVTVRDHGEPPLTGDASLDLFRYIVRKFSDELNPKVD